MGTVNLAMVSAFVAVPTIRLVIIDPFLLTFLFLDFAGIWPEEVFNLMG